MAKKLPRKAYQPRSQIGAGGVFDPNAIHTGDAAGGDLSGAYPNPSVVDDSHNHTAATLPPTMPPDPHAVDHQNGGADEINVGGLSGELADAQPVEIQEEGTPVGTRSAINFIGATVTATDDPGNDRVDVTITGGAGTPGPQGSPGPRGRVGGAGRRGRPIPGSAGAAGATGAAGAAGVAGPPGRRGRDGARGRRIPPPPVSPAAALELLAGRTVGFQRRSRSEGRYRSTRPPEDRTAMKGASATLNGETGLVPKPVAGDHIKALLGTGLWSTLSAFIDAALVLSAADQGSILYRGATVWTVLGPGLAKQFLKTGGGGANPSWDSPGPHALQKLTVGTTTYTPTTNTRNALLIVIGAGGGGGGTTGSGSNAAGGAGGGGGSVCIHLLTGVTGTYSVSIGAKGTGGAAGADGTEGGDTTFTNGGDVYTGEGGNGGAGMAFGTAFAYSQAGAGGTVGTVGDFNSGGDPGMYGQRGSGTQAAAGKGGSCGIFGGGGLARVAHGNGFAGGGFGSGGGGAVSVSAADRTGGDGADGVIFVLEFP